MGLADPPVALARMRLGIAPPTQAADRPAMPPSKFAPPRPPSAQVLRAGLAGRLCRSFSGCLTLLRAPTGFGKTSLLQACREDLRAAGVRVAWITLDASDNDVTRLVHCLAAAIAAALPSLRMAPGFGPAAQNGPPTAAELFEQLARVSEPLAIVLDDFEELQDAAALHCIAALVEHLPVNSGLMLATRRMPDLPLSRLRARGRLVELDQAALRFSENEAEVFLNAQRGLGLAAYDVARLHARTEGWPAGLWLASVALERTAHRAEFIDGFSGSDATVSDYLAECVLARQSGPVRHFLLRTSVAAQLCEPLCEALLPGIDAAAMLHTLVAADIPLAALEGPGRWHRYHGMFAAFLRSVLEREAPHEIPALHARAAHWFESQGRPVPAISHALAGDDAAHAMALLRSHARAIMKQGRARLLECWLSGLPAMAMQAESQLQAMHVWATTYTLGAQAATSLLERYALDHSVDEEALSCIRPLQPVLLALMDRVEESIAVGLRSLAQRPEMRGFSDAVLCCTVASLLANRGDHEQARQLLEKARRAEGGDVSAFTLMHCEAAEAIIDLQEARLRQALGRLRLAVQASRHAERTRGEGNAWAGVLHACALYETGDLALAERLLKAHAPAIHAVGMADMLILVYRCLARIAFGRGQVDDAFQALSELEYVGHRRGLERVVASAKLERARLLLGQGHHDAAQAELRLSRVPGLWERIARMRLLANEVEDPAIGELRWQVVIGNAGPAISALEVAITADAAAGRHGRVLRLRLLRALGLARNARHGDALAAVEDLLRDTAREGYVQMFADEGAPAARLVRHYTESLTGRRAAADAPFEAHAQRVLQACRAWQACVPDTEPTQPALHEALTRKELAVLELVAGGLGDSVIAERLFLSLSTVRTHLRNVYGKLRVHSRMQAVISARRHGLI